MTTLLPGCAEIRMPYGDACTIGHACSGGGQIPGGGEPVQQEDFLFLNIKI